MTRGFTMVEIAVVLAVAALLIGVAAPGLLGTAQKGRRIDATAALTRLHFAQERYHAVHGLYAADLGALVGARSPVSDGGLYDIRLVDAAGDRYTAVASARAGTAQAHDSACLQITLAVNGGVAEHGPTPACWNR